MASVGLQHEDAKAETAPAIHATKTSAEMNDGTTNPPAVEGPEKSKTAARHLAGDPDASKCFFQDGREVENIGEN